MHSRKGGAVRRPRRPARSDGLGGRFRTYLPFEVDGRGRDLSFKGFPTSFNLFIIIFLDFFTDPSAVRLNPSCCFARYPINRSSNVRIISPGFRDPIPFLCHGMGPI